MLEKPNLPDDLILSAVQEQYLLHPTSLSFLPLGYDVNTAVYRLATGEGANYFLKLRRGPFDTISVTMPHMLHDQGIREIIPPLATHDDWRWGNLGEFKLIVYPFIEGQDGYQKALTDQQWLNFGAALKGIHNAEVPAELMQQLQQETFSPHWREMVRRFQAQVEEIHFTDPVAAKLAAFMRARRSEISQVVERAEALSQAVRLQFSDLALCHGDIHPSNLLISPDGSIYIVDWDNQVLAPKEKDLALIGGCLDWSSSRDQTQFYQGYGVAKINPIALAFYRYERIVQDMAEFCKQLLLKDEGGKDREQSYQYFTSIFLPGHEIDLAANIDPKLTS